MKLYLTGEHSNELRRRAGHSGEDFARFNTASKKSFINAAHYVGAPHSEIIEFGETLGFKIDADDIGEALGTKTQASL